MIYNLMSGEGFVGGAYHHDWYMAWASLCILGIIVYVSHVLSKNDIIPSGFNWKAGLMGIVAAIVLIAFTGWSF